MASRISSASIWANTPAAPPSTFMGNDGVMSQTRCEIPQDMMVVDGLLCATTKSTRKGTVIRLRRLVKELVLDDNQQSFNCKLEPHKIFYDLSIDEVRQLAIKSQYLIDAVKRSKKFDPKTHCRIAREAYNWDVAVANGSPPSVASGSIQSASASQSPKEEPAVCTTPEFNPTPGFLCTVNSPQYIPNNNDPWKISPEQKPDELHFRGDSGLGFDMASVCDMSDGDNHNFCGANYCVPKLARTYNDNNDHEYNINAPSTSSNGDHEYNINAPSTSSNGDHEFTSSVHEFTFNAPSTGTINKENEFPDPQFRVPLLTRSETVASISDDSSDDGYGGPVNKRLCYDPIFA